MYSYIPNSNNYSSPVPVSNRSFPMSSNSYSSMPNDSRLIGGGFLGPFVLGGITGGLLAPAFYPRPYPYPRPIYGPFPQPYYGPYYR